MLPIPISLDPKVRYSIPLLGRRVRHRHLGSLGRLNGFVKEERGHVWFEVDTEGGRYWWPNCNVESLGPIPMPEEDSAA